MMVWMAIGLPARPEWADAIVKAHNGVRRPLRLKDLSWSGKLAKQAQKWADHLIAKNKFEHPHKVPYGQNLYEITGGRAAPEQVVNAWASESRDYDLRTNHCSSDCGHYTQIVWRDTREVGCAVARDARREVWVCDYSPPGNWVGKRPY
jgi:uncharacterized protein YkwD